MSTPAPAPLPIPVDLFISKKHPGLQNGDVGFADSSGKIVFRVTRVPPSSKSLPPKMALFDASGNPLMFILRVDSGSWKGYKGESNEEKDLVFTVKRTLNKFTRSELDVFLVGRSSVEPTLSFKVKGFAFRRSCIVYRGDSIVAQTSLMYKLHQIFAGRSKFRLTIFPGSVDGISVVSIIAIFVYGQKRLK